MKLTGLENRFIGDSQNNDSFWITLNPRMGDKAIEYMMNRIKKFLHAKS